MKVAVVGATGAVGTVMLELLEKRKFPVQDLKVFATARSQGRKLRCQGREWTVEVLKPGCFEGVDIAFFDASDAVSKDWALQAAEAGAWVVDNSATYRMEKDVPLVVPEVNGHKLRRLVQIGRANLHARERIVAGPNCSTIQLVVALKPIAEHWGLKRVVVSSYQSVSGAGSAAMDELTALSKEVLGGTTPRELKSKVLKYPIAFNCIPQIGGFMSGTGGEAEGATSEEYKIITESRKILGLPELKITATAVRVPTYACHAESVNIECEKPFELDALKKTLADFPGIVLEDSPQDFRYPMGIYAHAREAVYVGRIRRDFSLQNGDNGLNCWVVSDNLWKGAALNAIQIGEVLTRQES